jgi:hypothetical protein
MEFRFKCEFLGVLYVKWKEQMPCREMFGMFWLMTWISGSFQMLGNNFLPMMQLYIPPEWNPQQIYWKIMRSSQWHGWQVCFLEYDALLMGSQFPAFAWRWSFTYDLVDKCFVVLCSKGKVILVYLLQAHRVPGVWASQISSQLVVVVVVVVVIIIIFINCNWVVTWWQWAHEVCKLSALHTSHFFYAGNIPGTHFC